MPKNYKSEYFWKFFRIFLTTHKSGTRMPYNEAIGLMSQHCLDNLDEQGSEPDVTNIKKFYMSKLKEKSNEAKEA